MDGYAERLRPEVVQLWYQMAVNGRRDLELAPAPLFEGSERPGAWARIMLPQVLPEREWEGDEKSKITEKLRESMR